MKPATGTRKIPRNIQSLLQRLRARIRAYVWVEGIARALIWLGLTFWFALAVDYLPVLVGASEMPTAARIATLGLIGAVLAWILYRSILRRAFARLKDRSMAVLLERAFPEFKDSLLTTVELADGQSPQDTATFAETQTMLDETTVMANERLGEVRLDRVFRMGPLIRQLTFAGVLVLSIGTMAIFANKAFGIWTSRLYLLSDQTWPRRAQIELLGFEDGKLKVAKGSDQTIRVRADIKKKTPAVCTIIYRTENGNRGRVNMSRDGEPRDGYQHYVFAGKPFRGILDGVRFDVVGFDHRLRDYDIQVVDPPTLVKIDLECQYPQYIQKGKRTVAWSTGAHFPIGSKVTVQATANKPLAKVSIQPREGQSQDVPLDENDPKRFDYHITQLDERVALEVELVDVDGISSQVTQRITIGADEDRPPDVEIGLQGIGSAITPQARIPARGTVQDDIGVAASWFQLLRMDEPPRDFPVELQPGGKLEAELDLRKQQANREAPLKLMTSTQVTLAVQARDGYDLGNEPNIGTSDVYELDVVKPEELLARLEARELGLRRRFEQIIAEMQTTRDGLQRIRDYWDEAEAPSGSGSVLPDDESLADDDAQKRALSFQVLRIQRSIQSCEKAAQEVFGVASSFEDIREELINNRVDTEERKERLQKLIADPLHRIADPMFPDLIATLDDLEPLVKKRTQAIPVADQSIQQADEVLLAMQQVLDQMLELETYNELVDIVRSIIKEQASLADETKELRKRDLLDGLGP